MNKGGRPKKQIDKTEFEKLCMLQCTKVEFCCWFDLNEKTLTAWCHKNYGMGFYDIFSIKRGTGKISLRRSQWQMAEKNAAMAIWLGKQYLGQKDQPEPEKEPEKDKIDYSKFSLDDLTTIQEILKKYQDDTADD